MGFFSFLRGKGSAFLAAATPSPLTTPNPLEKPFKVNYSKFSPQNNHLRLFCYCENFVLRTDLTNFIKNSFKFLIKF